MKINKFFEIAVIILLFSCCMADDIVLGLNGRTKHQIVVPDVYANEAAKESVERAAKLIQELFAANKIELETVRESARDPKKNGIYLGATKFAAQNGVDATNLKEWRNIHKAVGKNVIIAGNDRPDPIPEQEPPAWANGLTKSNFKYRYPYLATLYSTAEFLYRYAGARYLKPGADGIVFLPKSIISVPERLNSEQEPFLLEHAWTRKFPKDAGIFEYANHAIRPQRLMRTAHLHSDAFTPALLKEHPEWRAMLANGVRTQTRHLCYSNPEVIETIYAYLLKSFDAGFDIVEVTQPDGFVPCACRECYNQFGVSPTAKSEDGYAWLKDPAWGEKLWHIHKQMAERLTKDRPGKKMMCLAYSITGLPPKTIGKLPENIVVEICNEDTIPDWEAYAKNVPGGFGRYTYWWGNYDLMGNFPRNTIAQFQNNADICRKLNLRYTTHDFPPQTGLYGLEGPMIYVFLRLGISPDHKNADQLYNEYLEAAFQEAETPMRRFFNRLTLSLDWYAVSRKQIRKTREGVIRMLNIMYTPETINLLESELARAETTAVSEGVKNRIAAVRGEFDLLKAAVNVCFTYQNYLKNKDQASLLQLLDAVDTNREQEKAFLARKNTPYNPSNLRSQAMMNPRNLFSISPFNWDTAKMRTTGFDSKVYRTKAVFTEKAPALNSPEWNKIPAETLIPAGTTWGETTPLISETSFRVMYDQNHLYIRVSGTQEPELNQFKVRGNNADLWTQESISFQLSPKLDKAQYYYFAYDPVQNSYCSAEHGFITDPLDPRFGWNDWTWRGDWKYESKIGGGHWESMAVIPFKTIKTTMPGKGNIWYFNLGRAHFSPKINNRRQRELAGWNGYVVPSQVMGDAQLGELVFE